MGMCSTNLSQWIKKKELEAGREGGNEEWSRGIGDIYNQDSLYILTDFSNTKFL